MPLGCEDIFHAKRRFLEYQVYHDKLRERMLETIVNESTNKPNATDALYKVLATLVTDGWIQVKERSRECFTQEVSV